METGHKFNDPLPRGFSRVRREIDTVNEKIDSVNTKIENMADGFGPLPARVGRMENNLTTKSERLSDLEYRNKQHSAKLKMLEKELHVVRLDSDRLLDQAHRAGITMERNYSGFPADKPGKGQGHNDVGNQLSPREAEQYPTAQQQMQPGQGRDPNYRPEIQQTNKESDLSPWQQGSSPSPRRQEQLGTLEQTSARPPSIQPTNVAQKGAKTDIAKTNQESDQSPWLNKSQVLPGNDSNEAKRYEYDVRTARYDEIEEEKWRRRKQIYSTFDSTAINPQRHPEPIREPKYPWQDKKTHPYPGGLMLLRFEDSAFDTVKVALVGTQRSICRRANGGLLLGIGRKNKLFVFESSPSKQQNWQLSRRQPYKDVLMTENAIAAFWFTTSDSCEQFFQNSHYNRFREPCFPTPNGYEAFYVPLQSTPPLKPYDTFLFIEFLDGRQYRAEDMTQFEAEVRHDMVRMVPDCLPMVVSSQSGRKEFRPGAFVSPYSKLFVCRFVKQEDVDEIWRSGMIQALRMKWNLAGPVNVFCFTLDEVR